MIRLINSAMMPAPGRYHYKYLRPEDFFNKVRAAAHAGDLRHYIGYQQNIDIINKQTGLSLKPCRDETKFRPGDTILVMKLAYRTSAPKGAKIDESKFIYGEIFYEIEATTEQQRFLDAAAQGRTVKYSFEEDETTITGEAEQWKSDIIELERLAKERLGVGYQKKLARQIGVKRQTINRLFSLRFSPTFKILFAIVKALELEIIFSQKKP